MASRNMPFKKKLRGGPILQHGGTPENSSPNNTGTIKPENRFQIAFISLKTLVPTAGMPKLKNTIVAVPNGVSLCIDSRFLEPFTKSTREEHIRKIYL
jgi:hypothetical protein